MKPSLFRGALLALVLILLPSVARADDPHGKPEWYGWQTAAVDAVSILTVLGASGKSEGVAYVGGGGYLLGAPVVHVAHGHPDKAFGSVLLRVAAPLAFGYAGYEAFGGRDAQGWGPAIGAVLGGAVGMGVASVVDATVLAWDKPRPAASARIAPSVSVSPNGAMIGVGGTL